MDEILEALRTIGWPVWDTDASGANLGRPYVLVIAAHSTEGEEASVCNDGGILYLRVRHVSTSAGSVRAMIAKTRVVLRNKRFHSNGLILDAQLDDSTDVNFDAQVFIPGTQTHPCYADDEYKIFVQ